MSRDKNWLEPTKARRSRGRVSLLFSSILFGLLLRLGASGCFLANQVTSGCSTWPPVGDVEEVLLQHESAVREIEAINPGHTDIIVNTWKCPGKSHLTFTYATLDDKWRIEDIIGTDTFFGVTFTLQNV